jgi:hypothetical protein
MMDGHLVRPECFLSDAIPCSERPVVEDTRVLERAEIGYCQTYCQIRGQEGIKGD